MARLAHPSLPDDLRARLERIGDALRSGLTWSLPQAEIEAAAARLAAMPADAVPMAGGMVAQALAAPYGQSPPVRPAILARLLGRPDDAAIPAATPALQTLLLFHPDGRRREAALHELATLSDSPFLVAAIVYRLNDWAGPVREAARGCALRLLPATDPAAIARALEVLLLRMPSWRRWQENRAVLDAIMAMEPVMDALAEGLCEARQGPMARLLRHALAWPGLDPHLLDLAGRARLPAVRMVALRALIEGRAVWPVGYERVWVDKVYGIGRRAVLLAERPFDRPVPVEALIRLGLDDRSAAPRRIAAEGLILHRRSLGDIAPLVERLAGDKNPSVRERAAFLAARLAAPGGAG